MYCKCGSKFVLLNYGSNEAILKTNKMITLNEAIADAKKIKSANKMEFATIWKTGKSFGFNFDKKEVGYSAKNDGVKRTVIAIV